MKEFGKEHLLFFAFAVLAIVVIWDIRQKIPATNADAVPLKSEPNDPTLSNVPTLDNTGEAPDYLTYNSPYYFAPTGIGFLPETTEGYMGIG